MVGQPLSIRKATPDDAPGILECLRLAFEPYRESYTPLAFEDTVLSPSTIRHRLAGMSVFVAVSRSGEIAGTIGCTAAPLRPRLESREPVLGKDLPGGDGADEDVRLRTLIDSLVQ